MSGVLREARRILSPYLSALDTPPRRLRHAADFYFVLRLIFMMRCAVSRRRRRCRRCCLAACRRDIMSPCLYFSATCRATVLMLMPAPCYQSALCAIYAMFIVMRAIMRYIDVA